MKVAYAAKECGRFPYIVGCRYECCYLVIVMCEKVIIFEKA